MDNIQFRILIAAILSRNDAESRWENWEEVALIKADKLIDSGNIPSDEWEELISMKK